MNYRRTFLIVFFQWIAGISCNPVDNSSSDTSQKTSLISISVTNYNLETIQLKVLGELFLSGVSEINMIEVYTNDSCEGLSVGSGSYKSFNKEGLEISVASKQKSQLYVKNNAFPGCFFLTQYQFQPSPPNPPTFLSSNPLSPSKISASPLLLGNVSQFTSKVQLFSDDQCAQLLGEGSAEEFSTVGFRVQLPENKLSTIYSIALEPFGLKSNCILFTEYKHHNIPPAPPVFKATEPASPSRSSRTPKIMGISPNGKMGISIYTDTACTELLASGNSDEFSSSGLSINVSENSSTPLYGQFTDDTGMMSSCSYLTNFIHDNIIPSSAPTFTSANPVSPTRLTYYPLIKGQSSSDTATIVFFDASCVVQLGQGSKESFESTGIQVSVTPNSITSIYARSKDAAGNSTSCVFLTDYKHNVIPPDLPVFGATDPVSPNNQSTTPKIIGSPSFTTVSLDFYRDDHCTAPNHIGTGLANEFLNPGIAINALLNATTTVYATATDQEGNISECTFLTNYDYSNLPAQDPQFIKTSPQSPSRLTNHPFVIGNSDPKNSIINIYKDMNCTSSQWLNSGSRIIFLTIGISVTVNLNTSTDLYAKAIDIYGNESNCVWMTNYIHNNVPPFDPSYMATNPVSPNNQSFEPLVIGQTYQNPASLLPPSVEKIYDGPLCLNQIGVGPTSTFSNQGISTNVVPNMMNTIYSRTFDDAGNMSNCTFMTIYTHDSLKPGSPKFGSTIPASPSYSEKTLIKGTIRPSSDFLPISSVNIYSDSACSQLLLSGTSAQFTGMGISLTLQRNSTTYLYANTINTVGTSSDCIFMSSYFHNDVGPQNLTSTLSIDGSVQLNWLPDQTASPNPQYIVKRSLRPGGPYTLLTSSNLGTSFIDSRTTNSTTYYYVVAATNNTGTSYDSNEISQNVSISNADSPASLIALAGPSEISLSWSGFSSDMNYKIFRSSQSGGPYSLIQNKLKNTSFKDQGLSNGVPYYYIVVGSNPAQDSITSNEASATPLDYPLAPQNLELTFDPKGCSGNPGVRLHWTAPSYYNQFSINRGPTSGSLSSIALVSGTEYTECNFVNQGANNHQPNYYNITATYGANQSLASNTVGFSNMQKQNVTVYSGDGQNYLFWSGDIYAQSYQIWRSTKSEGPYTALSVSLSTASFLDTAVVNDTTYYYVIYANYPNGLVGWPSTEVSGMPHGNPNGPSNLVIVPITTSTPINPQLFWSKPSYFNYFNIYRAANFGGPYSFLASTFMGTYTDSTVPTGISYYKVTAVWGSFETPSSNITYFRNGVSSSLSLTMNINNLALSWTAVSGATSYKIYRSLTSGGPYVTPLTTVTAPTTTYTDNSVTQGIGYFYVVAAVFGDGSQGQNSTEVSGITNNFSVPSGLTIIATSGSGITLAWAKVFNATQYRVYQSTSANGVYIKIGTTNSNITSYSDTNLLFQSTYFYKVTAVVSGTESSKSNYVSATTLINPSPPDGIPGDNSIDVTWVFVGGALTYTLERSSNGVTFTPIASGLTALTYSDTGVTNGSQYFYRINALFTSVTLTSGVSPPITPGIVPLIPQGLTVVENITGSDLKFSWLSVPIATSYKIYSSTSPTGPWSNLVLSTSSSVEVTATGVTPGVPTYFVVTALNGSVESQPSQAVGIIPMASPNAPIAAVTSSSTSSISWAAVAGAVTYDLQRASDNFSFSTIATGLITGSYSDGGLISGGTYNYRYISYDNLGIPMAYSQVSAPITVDVPPLTPQNLLATSPMGSQQVNLEWVPQPNVVSYKVYRSSSSGGPYTSISTIPAINSNYSDSSVSLFQTYYYVIVSMNSSQVESSFSNEVAITLNPGPLSLTANNNTNQIQLSWNVMGSAQSYSVYRSEKLSGPYGLISSGLTSNAYNDQQVLSDHSYNYIVKAVFADGSYSQNSNTASIVGFFPMNLQVPIEMIDSSIGSDLNDVIFERSLTSLDPAAYNGTVQYYFELIGLNSGAFDAVVYIIDSNDQNVGSLIIPANTTLFTRLRNSFTPNVISDKYRIKVAGTTQAFDVQVTSARLIVNQIGATRTKLYWPLLADSQQSLYSNSDITPIEQVNLSTYKSLNQGSYFMKKSQNYSNIIDYNPWEFEAIVRSNGSAKGRVALYNENTMNPVENTETVIIPSGGNGNNMQYIFAPFNEEVSQFGAANEGNIFSVRMLCSSSCVDGNLSIYKSGLWLTLDSLNSADIFFRMSRGSNNLSSSYEEGYRQWIDSSLFTNPSYFFQLTGSIGNMMDTASIQLASHGNNDSGVTGLSSLLASQILFSQNVKSLTRTGSFSLGGQTNSRWLLEKTPGTSPLIINDSYFIIRITK